MGALGAESRKDAGELANGEPIGLAATNDADALIALQPDCVIYAASGPERDALAIPDYVKLLQAGINVVTTSTTRLVDPHASELAEWRDQLAAAAKQGQASLYASGIEPGYRVAITGDPDIECTLAATLKDPHRAEVAGMTSGAGAMVATLCVSSTPCRMSLPQKLDC